LKFRDFNVGAGLKPALTHNWYKVKNNKTKLGFQKAGMEKDYARGNVLQ